MRLAASRSRPALVALLACALWACSDSLVEVGGDLSFELTGPSTASLADSVKATYQVQGKSLLGLAVDWGDGAEDSVLSFSGAQSAGGQISHKYSEPGDYRVTGKVQDGLEGSIMAEFLVTVTP